VHLGDVFEKDDGTVYGDGVNIASRLQGLAEPDGLTVSQSVQVAVQGRVAARFEALGAHSVKNIAQPVQVFRVRAGAAVRAAAAAPRGRLGRVAIAGLAAAVLTGALGVWLAGVWPGWPSPLARRASTTEASAGKKTIAVLPFANVGDDKANEFLTDGVTDELIELLSRVQGLRVTGRDSSFYFKGKQVPMPEMARQLGVSYLVGGSVRRDGARVRIGAQLLNAADGAVLWSRSFDREFKDVLAAQAEIALGIAGSLTQSLDSSASFGGRSTNHPEAWAAFLEAKRLPEGPQRIAAYERVLALDPQFARVHGALAEEALGMGFRGELTKVAARQRMVKHLEDALRIDPTSDHAHGLLGASARLVDDVEALRRHARRALEVNPDGSAGHAWTAELKLLDGDISGALTGFKQSAEQLPLVLWARNQYAEALRFANQPALALQEAEKTLALDPNYVPALAEKARDLLMLGRRDEALALARERNFRGLLLRFGIPEDQAALLQRKNLSPHDAAWQQFALGRPDAVVEHLAAEHTDDIQARNRVLFDAEYDPVRGLPAFKAWLAKHKLTEAHERAQAWRAANPVRQN
jgi:adenylate cyclase